MNYDILVYSFHELAEDNLRLGDEVITAIETLAAQLAKEVVPDGDDYLKDKLNYREFILGYERGSGELPDFGRVFLAKEQASGRCVGFALCIDNVFKAKKINLKKDPYEEDENSNSSGVDFPIEYCQRFFAHDIPYLRDLNSLGYFSYCFQLGVEKLYQRTGCAKELMDAIELSYCNQVLFLAASIHENQHGIIKLLHLRNETALPRHEETNKEYFYLFLDHYFDSSANNGHWFRVIQILDNREFVSKINFHILPNAYNTIIPIQLNQAIINVNKIIHKLGAKVLWSSFFNASDLLRGRYGMGKDNHGFFESLLEANDEQYKDCTAHLQKITQYLREKDSPTSNVVSLTESFKRNSYELFFFDKTEHLMHSFSNPLTVSIAKPKEIFWKLLSSPGLQKNKALESLNKEQKDVWKEVLFKYTRSREDKGLALEWQKWKERLLLSEAEAILLEKWSFGKINKCLAPEEKISYNKLKSILRGRKILSDEHKRQWETFIDLHKVLFSIDAAVFKKSDKYWWCHAMVPINYSKGGNMVGIMFSFRCRKLPATHKEYQTRMDNLAYLITGALSKNMLNILIKLKDKDAIESANRYAIAAVTSRNMAHNLGSHILANLDTPDAIRMFRQSKRAADFDEELARFNAFVRTKTNLLADMVTSEPVSTVSKWLKREVVDEFNRQEIVKKYISGTHIQEIRIHYLNRRADGEDDILVQVPNGDLGVGAFFMLLENIIRNSAKYEDTSQLHELKLTVEVERIKARGYYLLLYDHIQRTPEDLSKLVHDINNGLNAQNTEIGNKIKSSGWGLTEMKAAAAYLRKKVPGIIVGLEEDKLEIPFIQALSHPLQPDVYTLAYKIYLKKPRNVIIVNHQGIFSKFNYHKFIEQGVKIIPQEELVQDSKEIHSHALMIYFESHSLQAIEKRKRFPLRCILLENKANWLVGQMQNMQAEDFVLWAWEAWLHAYAQRKGKSLSDVGLYLFREGAETQHSSLGKQLSLLEDELSDERMSETITNLENCFVYDSHGKHLPQEITGRKSELGFYQSFSSVDPTGRILNNVKTLTNEQRKALRLQLLEAAMTTVVVVDERIQRDALRIRNNRRKEDFFETLRQMRIHLPDPDKEEPDLSNMQKITTIETWLNQVIIQHQPDFIVLHLGLLESWLNSDMNTVSKWLDDMVANWNITCEIVLISGRGKPHQFPSSVSYQPASTLAEYIVGGPPSKYHLVQLLFSSRTRAGLI